MSIPDLNRESHHGIVLLWSDVRAVFTGTLIFAVGVRDETARTAGLSHLLEHLVMSQVGHVAIPHNASTEEDRIAFFAEGPEHAVVDFLQRVAAAVRGLDSITDAVVAEQVRVISAELGELGQMPGTGPLLERFGAAGLGLVDYGAPAHRTFTRDDALDWARRWLVAENAAITLSGPVPASLDVQLPAATEPITHRDCALLATRRVGWLAGGAAPLVLSMVLDGTQPGMATWTSFMLDRALQHELRTRRSLIYSVSGFGTRLSRDEVFIAIMLDPPRESIREAAAGALEVLRGLAAAGTVAETAEAWRSEWELQAEHPDAHRHYLPDAASNLLRFGIEPTRFDEFPPGADSPETVSRLLTAALDTLVVSMGEVEGFSSREAVTEFLGMPSAGTPAGYYESMGLKERIKAFMRMNVTMHDPRRFKGHKGETFVVDPERLTWFAPDNTAIEVRFDEAVAAGVCTTCGHWEVTAADGSGLVVEPELWKGSDKLVSALEERIPVHLRYAVSHAAPAEVKN